MSECETSKSELLEEKSRKNNEVKKKVSLTKEEQNLNECKKKQVSLYAKKSDIKEAWFSRKSILVLMYKKVYLNTNDLNVSLPSVFVSLLQEYEDAFPEDIPNGLSPIRGINHQIDFIPGASIPNKLVYRSNPDETKEFQRQVEELSGKGFVRESMNSCAVLILLVPKKDSSWRMYVDCRAINNITVKYCHPISRLDDMLDELYGSTIFSRIDLKVVFIKFE